MDTCTLMRDIAETRIEPAGATLTFGRRLAQENDWLPAYAARVEAEYRRFLYLIAISDGELTPSDAVDQAWHLHLAYSRHYWDELCGRILRRPLHHGPTAGGTVQRDWYRVRYAVTLALYEKTFGERPPRDIWPSPSERFNGRWRRVDAMSAIIVPLNRWTGLPLGILCLWALHLGVKQGNAALLILFAWGVLGAVLHQYRRSRDGRAAGFEFSVDGGCTSDSGCGGGCGGCGGD